MGILQKIFGRADRKRREYVVEAQNYLNDHKESLIILADPDTDVMVIGYKDLIVPIHFHKQGKKTKTIENALNYRKMNNSIDNFLLAIDGALANIAVTLFNRKYNKDVKLEDTVRAKQHTEIEIKQEEPVVANEIKK